MKRIGFLLLALLVCLSLFACSKKDGDVPQGYLDAGTEGVNYRFFYPDTWQLDRSDPGMTSVYYSETDFSNVSVTAFTADPRYKTASEYAENYYFEHFADNFNNLEVEKNQDGTIKLHSKEVGGSEGVYAEYAAVFAGEMYRFRSYFTIYNGEVYTVTYTAKADVFTSHTEAVTGMVEQMRFQ